MMPCIIEQAALLLTDCDGHPILLLVVTTRDRGSLCYRRGQMSLRGHNLLPTDRRVTVESRKKRLEVFATLAAVFLEPNLELACANEQQSGSKLRLV